MKVRYWILKFWLLGCLILFFCTCKEDGPRRIEPAFYHWQTKFDLSQEENIYLDSLNVRKLYLKFFDVDWDIQNKEAVPLAAVQFGKDEMAAFEIIPTIFITNRTVLNLAESRLEELSEKILKKIKSLWEQIPFKEKQKFLIQELQFDCDWSANTRAKYFQLLKLLKSKSASILSNLASGDIQFSSTIRLHQIKYYKKTGLPPVDKGMLMFYNMGELEDPWESNSILNVAVGKTYVKKLKNYPLKLDLALPIFAWGVLFRDRKMIKLLNNLKARDLADEDRFSRLDGQHFKVIKSTYLEGHYLYENDVIRLESIENEELEKAALLLDRRLKKNDLTVSFYHLDTATIQDFKFKELENILKILE